MVDFNFSVSRSYTEGKGVAQLDKPTVNFAQIVVKFVIQPHVKIKEKPFKT